MSSVIQSLFRLFPFLTQCRSLFFWANQKACSEIRLYVHIVELTCSRITARCQIPKLLAVSRNPIFSLRGYEVCQENTNTSGGGEVHFKSVSDMLIKQITWCVLASLTVVPGSTVQSLHFASVRCLVVNTKTGLVQPSLPTLSSANTKTLSWCRVDNQPAGWPSC